MKKLKVSIWDVIYWIALLTTDAMIYMFLGLMMMGYDDNYSSDKGEYWSWESMNHTEKLFDMALIGWNIINIIFLIRIILKIIRFFRSSS